MNSIKSQKFNEPNVNLIAKNTRNLTIEISLLKSKENYSYKNISSESMIYELLIEWIKFIMKKITICV